MTTSTIDLDRERMSRDALIAELTRAGAEIKGHSVKCPWHEDKNPSGSLYADTEGVWRFKCLACGVGGDVFDLRARIDERPLGDVLREADRTSAPAAPGPARQAKPIRTYATAEDAARAIAAQVRGCLVGQWAYHNAAGDVVLQVLRFDVPDGKKTFRPIRPIPGGWTQGDPAPPLPLYELPRIEAADDSKIVVVAEGEKTADAALSIGLLATTSSHGAGQADRTDWSALAGKNLILLPDNDRAGARYAEGIARIVSSLSPPAQAKIVNLPGLASGGDLVDWVSADGAMGCKSDDEVRDAVLHLAQGTPPWTPPDQSETDRIAPNPMPAAALLAQFPVQREAIIEGLIRRGEVGNVISAAKSYKSWTLLSLACCVATGRPWLRFPTRQGRVLMLDFELHGSTLAKRLQAVTTSMKLLPADLADRLAIEPLRGRYLDVYGLGHYLSALPAPYDLIVVDPLYRLFTPDVDENSNANLAALFSTLQRYAETANAALLVVHHLTKGGQADRQVTDLGSGGGAQARAADCHLAIRPHAEPDAAVLAGVLRSWPPFEPISLRWKFPLWQIDDELDPTDLWRPPRRTTKKPADPIPLGPRLDTAWLVREILTDKPLTKDAIVALAIEAGMSSANQATLLLKRAEATGQAYRWKLPRDNRSYYAEVAQPVLTEAK